ncbi:hypothetical protein G6F68_009960 [Rhizopus microsporus]|nr:hypothetical protein G6F68_009960 [Rhizopus microsporus]
MGQHRRLGMPGGAGSEKEPAGVIVIHIGANGRRAGPRLDQAGHIPHGEIAGPQPRQQRQLRHGVCDSRGMPGVVAMAQERLGARRPGQIHRFIRRNPEIGRHPHRSQPQGGEQGFYELEAIARVHQHAVALAYAMIGQRLRQRRRPLIEFAPGIASWARFLTRRETGATPPGGAAGAWPRPG